MPRGRFSARHPNKPIPLHRDERWHYINNILKQAVKDGMMAISVIDGKEHFAVIVEMEVFQAYVERKMLDVWNEQPVIEGESST